MSTSIQQDSSSTSAASAAATDAGVNAVLHALRGLRFGSIEVVVHNGRIVQVERREKVRVDAAS